MTILRHIFRLNIPGRGYTVLVGHPVAGFREAPLGTTSALLPASFFRTQDRIDQALSTGKLSWSMTFRRDGNRLAVVGYGCLVSGSDDKGRRGLSFLHSIELTAATSVYRCVRGLVQLLNPGWAPRLTELIEDVTAGAVDGERSVKEIASAVENGIASCLVQTLVTGGLENISSVEHNCAGAGPVAWSLLSLVHDGDESWEVYDTVKEDGGVFTLAESALASRAGKYMLASQLFDAGVRGLANPIGSVEQDSNLGHDKITINPVAPENEGLAAKQYTMHLTAQPTDGGMPQQLNQGFQGAQGEIQSSRVNEGLVGSYRNLIVTSAICLLLGLTVGIQLGKKQDTFANKSSAPSKPTPRHKPTPRPRIRAGETLLNPKDGLAYVWLPATEFDMGCTSNDAPCDADEQPLHKVWLSKGYWIGQTEVTLQAYSRYVHNLGRSMPEAPTFDKEREQTTSPIVNVTWKDAAEYCQYVGGHLPTEAEWEFAARGAETQKTITELYDRAWVASNSGSTILNEESLELWLRDLTLYTRRLDDNLNTAHPVGMKRANGYGLFDMLGNVWEWCEDWFDPKYYSATSGAVPDPQGPPSGKLKVLRGGSYRALQKYVRISNRNADDPAKQSPTYGFRCVVKAIN